MNLTSLLHVTIFSNTDKTPSYSWQCSKNYKLDSNNFSHTNTVIKEG